MIIRRHSLGTATFIASPAFQRRFNLNGWIIWGALIPIAPLTGLKTSITFLVITSVWANFVGHLGSWASAIVAEHQASLAADVVAEMVADSRIPTATG